VTDLDKAVASVRWLDFTLDQMAEMAPLDANTKMLTGYHVLSDALALLLHGDYTVKNATFPTFAMWTAETLRSEIDRQQGRPLQPYGLLRPGRTLYRRAAKAILGNDDVIGRNLALGEAAIYGEIGAALCALIVTAAPATKNRWYRKARTWPEIWDAYTAELGKAPGLLNASRPGGRFDMGVADVVSLQDAVRPYFQVLAHRLTRPGVGAKEHKERAELILLGNIRLEAYAQTRLGPVLERNLSYIPDALRAVVGTRLTGRNTLRSQMLRKAYDRVDAAGEIVDEAFEIAATRHVFSMVLGTEELAFGRDLPLAPPANPVLRDRQPEDDRERYVLGSFFPHELRTLRSREVWAAWQRFDRSTGEGARTAVDNWLRYEERLNFIVNFMRSRQQLTALYGRPRSLPAAIPPRPAALAPTAPEISDDTLKRVGILGDGA
jgi:hypothetical protein